MSILKAFSKIKKTNLILKDSSKDIGTRINKVGDSFELFIQNLFDKNEFSYLGNPNNPPDIMLKDAEAIEIKKVSNITSDIALNSSFPKSKLYATDKMLIKSCIDCEKWKTKDIVYAIGCVKNKKIRNIWFVYGNCYAADNNVYQNIKNKINSEIKNISNTEWSDTRELGRINRVDPLGITYLRVRGMWAIQHPQKVFSEFTDTYNNMYMIMEKDKFNSFSEKEKTALKTFSVSEIKINNPDNPAKKLQVILIKGKV